MNEAVHSGEILVAAVLVQLAIIILAARAAGAIAVSLRQPRAVGEIIAGLLLGPSFFGFLAPGVSTAVFPPSTATPVMVISQVGLTLLMFQIGAEFDFSRLQERANRRVTIAVAAASIAAPLLVGYLLGGLTAPILAADADPVSYRLFIAIALAITAVPILGRILREYGLTRAPVGVIAISAAAINDVVGWVLLAGVAAYASTSFSALAAATQVAGIAALAAILFIVGPKAVDRLLKRFPIEDGAVPGPLMSIVLAAIFIAGVVTQRLGVFTIFGGFLVGLSFHKHEAFVAAWMRQVGQFVLVFFLPIFFTTRAFGPTFSGSTRRKTGSGALSSSLRLSARRFCRFTSPHASRDFPPDNHPCLAR